MIVDSAPRNALTGGPPDLSLGHRFPGQPDSRTSLSIAKCVDNREAQLLRLYCTP